MQLSQRNYSTGAATHRRSMIIDCVPDVRLIFVTVMAKLTVEGSGEVEVSQGKRMVLAIEDDAKIDIMHACGGNARCTTCRVEFVSGEPQQMTDAEKKVLTMRNLINQPGVRLSCQINCDHDMTVR